MKLHHNKNASVKGIRQSLLVWAGATSILMGSSSLCSVAFPQTSPIIPSGLNTQVSDPIAVGGQTQYDITGGTRPGGGPNLFHSFGEFGIPTNNIANFLNGISFDLNGIQLAPGLQTSNILARVTGTNGNNPTLSSIYGAIQTSDFGNANLFLMNPAGFLFGPNATVNVGGMVSFTSADYLRLGELGSNNAGIFHADPTQASVMTSVPVAAFGFLGSNPGAITVQGSQFTVTEGTGISLIGGNINIEAGTLDDATVQPARLSAPGGQINLASVASSGEVLASSFLPLPGMTMRTVNLSQGSTLDVSNDAAGTVRIRGGQFVMDNATISADTINANGATTAVEIQLTGDLSITTDTTPTITARATGSGDAGEVRISSANMEVISDPGDILAVIDSHTSGSGQAGNVSITTTGDLNVTGGLFPSQVFFIDTGTIGPDGGHGGDVMITARNVDIQQASINTGDFVANTLGEEAIGSGGNVTMTADTIRLTESFTVTSGFSAGNGGDLTLSARDIDINTFSALSTTGFENGGAVRINADRLTVDSSQFEVSNGGGSSGGITITGRVVEFTNGSTIASQTFGDQAGGNITITASDHLTLSDDLTTDGAITRPTGLYTNSIGIGGTLGTAGAITVSTPVLTITNGARIDSTSRTSGNAGAVTITTDSISISGERPFDPFGETQFFLGGRDLVSSGIYARTVGSIFCSVACGDAGLVSIATRALNLESGAQINSSTTNAGRGGNIAVHATDTIAITGTREDGASGGIFSRTIGINPGSGTGGTISLTGQSVTLGNEAVVSTDTTGTGAGGNIIVNANSVILQNGGTLSAATSGAADSATGGTITVNANQIQLNNGGLITASTTGAGAGGSITIGAGSTFVSSASTLSSAAAQAQGGDISITSGQLVALNNGSLITANSTGAGNAGNILINAGQNYISTDSAVTTQAAQASGGNITVLATDTVQLTNSQLNASVQGSSTTVGGNITIDPLYVIFQNSQILAQATQGQGGAISITITNGGLYLPDANSVISASSQFGVNGTVTIQSPNAPGSGKIQPLGKTPLEATSLLNQHCAALAGGEFSSFTVAGRNSLPTEPSSWLTSPLYAAGVGLGIKAEGVKAEGERLETPLLSLRQIAPAGFLTQAFAVDRSASCQS